MKNVAAWSDARRLLSGLLHATRGRADGRLDVGPAPIAVQYTPHSILADPTGHVPRQIGGRKRLATSSGVAWFHDTRIATVNLSGQVFHSYDFDPSRRQFTLLQTFGPPECVARPEHLAFSGNGRLMAISSGTGAVAVYRVRRDTHMVETERAATIQCTGDAIAHGVAFSPCSQHLVYSTTGGPGVIRVYRVFDDARTADVVLEPLQVVANHLAPLKPKSMAFTPDGRFVAVCYAPNAGTRIRHRGRIEVYGFTAERGLAFAAVSGGRWGLGLRGPDCMCLLGGGTHLALTNQADDSLTIVGFDTTTGALGRCEFLLQNPAAALSFPHGCHASADGRFLAVVNYGDDKLAVFAVSRNT